MAKGKTKTSSRTTGTATTTPNVPGFITGPYQQFLSQVTGFMGDNPQASTPNALQQTGWNNAQNLSPNSAIAEGMNGTRGFLNYSPDQVSADQLASTDLSPYMNPYTSGVIDTSLADLGRARDMAITGGNSAATFAKAFGGSRQGVADAETNRGFLDTAAQTVANLRNQNFGQAQDAARYDITNRLNTATGNADRNLAGAGLRFGAARQLSDQGLAADANARDIKTTQAGLSADQQANNPANARLRQLAQLAQILGINPAMFAGQTINQTGSSNGTSSTSGGLSFGWSPQGGFQFGYG